ncbi:MAG: hypothetical protein C5B52_11300 [Bacteroidetes bacterium]|nr:MAG: hypothetical protein C5B52_11300 [Bacteroidota bacterium]
MLPYMALVLQKDFKNINTIHIQTFEELRRNVPQKNYGLLTDTSNPYRKKMFTNAEEFYAQLPYYSIKPLYVEAVDLFYRMGISLPRATVLPSVLSYFLLGCILLLWVSSFLRLPYAVMSCLLFMLSSPFFTAGALSSPDGMSAVFLLAAFYFMLKRPMILPVFIFLLLAVWTRLDNVITAGLFVILWNVDWKKSDKNKLLISAGMLLVFAISYFVINSFAADLGGKVELYNRFYRFPNMVSDDEKGFSLSTYIGVLYSRGISGIYNSNIILAFLFSFLVLARSGRINFRNPERNQLFVLAFILIFIVRYLMYPEISDRFYLAFYLAIYVIFLGKYFSRPQSTLG